MDEYAISRECGGIEAAYRSKIEEALVIDVANNKAQFIAVPRKHNPGMTARVKGRDDISMSIDACLVGMLPYLLTHHLLDCLFIARGTGAGDQSFKKRDARFFHEI